VQRVSTRSVDELVKTMGMSGISKSQVSRLCEEIDDRVKTFLERPSQNLQRGRMQRDQARLAELGLLDDQDVVIQANIVELQVQRLADAQT
jgi:hypothetical protein